MDEQNIDVRFREFREAVEKMAEESSREAEDHLRKNESSMEFPFHEGQTGSLDLAVDYLSEIGKKGQVSPNDVEEAYISLLLSYKRMKGNLCGLERIIRAMQAAFQFPSEEDIDRIPEGLEVPNR